ncbi:MAG: carbohydrate ABC transporter permease [Bacillota bacterium]
MKNSLLSNKNFMPYLFLSPFIVFFVTFRLWPIIWSLYISFFNYNGINVFKFVGFENYISLLKDDTFRKAVVNTLFFVIVYNAIMISLALIFAVLLSSAFVNGRKIYRSIYFTPIAMSLPVVAMVFDLIFSRNGGLIASIMDIFGYQFTVRWFNDMNLAKWGILIMKVWRGTGYYCAYFLAGLSAIPSDIYESSKIDGAGPVATFFRITTPLLKPTLMFVIIMSSILSFQTFEEPWILTQGGPANSTLTLQIMLYRTSFLEGALGKGSAIAYLMTLLMMGFSILYVNRLSEKEGKQNGEKV